MVPVKIELELIALRLIAVCVSTDALFQASVA